VEAQYLETGVEHLMGIAGRMAGDGLVRMEGEFAAATSGLMGRAEKFENAMRTAVEELEKKHAFERG
jgi:CheY-specific phosphatase CheX